MTEGIEWAEKALAKISKPKKSKLLDQFGQPYSDSYCSPRWLTQRLPIVDTDPCSNPRSTVRARRAFSLEKKLDGIKLSWLGSVFLNFPYSDPLRWCLKLITEINEGRCTSAIVLCKLDTSTEWWHTLVGGFTGFGTVPELWTFDKRIMFDEPAELVAERVRKYAEEGRPGGEKSSTNFSSAIIHHRGWVPSKNAPTVAPLQLEDVATRWLAA